MHKKVFPSRPSQLIALGISASLLAPTLAGCGGKSAQTNTLPQAPPMSNNGRMMSQTAPKQGMSTKKKVVLVAGAALLYYLYRRHENAKTAAAGSDANGQYFVSKTNGRVYYRFLSGPNKGKFQYVSPPAPMAVPDTAAQQYNLDQYQGYPGASGGKEFGGYGATNQGNYNDAVPGTDLS